MTIRTTFTCLAALASAALLAGCSEVGGSPNPATPSAVTAPATSAAPTQVFAAVKACDLLGPAIAGTKLGKPKESSLGGCETDVATFGAASLDLHDGKSVDDLVVDRGVKTTTTLAGRDARMLAGNGGEGDCQFSIAAGPNSRALVGLTIGGSTSESCAALRPIAEKVAERLPQG